MLQSYLRSIPHPKFVLIEDNVEAKSQKLLTELMNARAVLCQASGHSAHYYSFERSLDRIKTKNDRITYHDCSNWLSDGKSDDFPPESNEKYNFVIVDSLAHVVYRHGVVDTLKIINEMKNDPGIFQLIAVLHVDLLLNQHKIVQCFRHLSTLHLELKDKRVSYTYKKNYRKTLKGVEEYRFEENRFICEEIKQPDLERIGAIVHQQQQPQVQPEDLTTFKIGLSDQDKQSRDKLTLPYLPKNTSTIHYSFDAVDDWDEEDPDDDLNI